MNPDAWIVVAAVGATTVALKAASPVLLGDRPLPAPVVRVLALLAPALLAALVATAGFGARTRLVVDARAAGLAVAAVAVRLRAPVLVVIVAAALATAIVRVV